jgi:hypothetical protein
LGDGRIGVGGITVGVGGMPNLGDVNDRGELVGIMSVGGVIGCDIVIAGGDIGNRGDTGGEENCVDG